MLWVCALWKPVVISLSMSLWYEQDPMEAKMSRLIQSGTLIICCTATMMRAHFHFAAAVALCNHPIAGVKSQSSFHTREWMRTQRTKRVLDYMFCLYFVYLAFEYSTRESWSFNSDNSPAFKQKKGPMWRWLAVYKHFCTACCITLLYSIRKECFMYKAAKQQVLFSNFQ